MIGRRELAPILGAATLAWPTTVRAQQPERRHHLMILAPAEQVDRATGKRDRVWMAFFDELRRLGHDEGRNLVVTWHSSEGDAQRVATLARDVVGLRPDVIYAPDGRMATALKAVTASIPIVAVTGDLVGVGLVASLARPGGNVTGFDVGAGDEIVVKRLELLKQAAPSVSRTAWLVPRRLFYRYNVREAARKVDITLIDAILEAPADEAEHRRVFAAMARDGADSLYVSAALESLAHRRLIAELAIGAKLASMHNYPESVEAGGLMSYGTDIADIYRHAAGYVDRIFRGSNPADMPVQQATRFELVINLRTAKALGLSLSALLLARADQVIE
jgi:putative ABC transport system substrate-binding protein